MLEADIPLVHIRSQVISPARPADLALLSPEERSRAASFRVEDAAAAFITARVLLRRTLSELTDIPAAGWRFRIDAAGRPWIAEPALVVPLYFSLSHAAGLAVCAVSTLPRVGIDIESLQRSVTLAAVSRVMAEDEIAALQAAPAAEQTAELLRLWTLKEAYAKAIGTGLSANLRKVAFDFSAAHPTLRHIGAASAEAWSLRQFKLHGSHLCAVALGVPKVSLVMLPA